MVLLMWMHRLLSQSAWRLQVEPPFSRGLGTAWLRGGWVLSLALRGGDGLGRGLEVVASAVDGGNVC